MNSGDVEPDLSDRLYTHVDRLAGLIGPRHLGKPNSLDVTATSIERAFVVLGAHYDSVPTTPGADDNASAVAMLIEVARMLQGVACQRTLRFVAVACEEPPYFHTESMGSQVYARRYRMRGEQIIGMICLEMVGYYRTEPNSQQIPPSIPRCLQWAFPHRGDFLAAVGNLRSWRLGWAFRRGFKRATRFGLYSISLPEAVWEIRMSDFRSYQADRRLVAIELPARIFRPRLNLIPNTVTEESMAEQQQTTNWPDLAIGLYDRLTGRNAEITYEFQDMHIKIPSGTGPNAEHAEWVLSGGLSIRTRDGNTAPN